MPQGTKVCRLLPFLWMRMTQNTPFTSDPYSEEAPPPGLTSLGETFARLRGMRITALIYLVLYPTPWFYDGVSLRDFIGSIAGLALFLVVYFARPAMQPHLWQGVAIALIGYAMSPFHAIWTVFIVYAGSLLAAAKPRSHAVAIFAALLVSLVLFCWLTNRPWPDVAFGSCFSIASFVATSLTIDLAREHRLLLEAQEEVRVLATSAERERIARDLHDLLGHSLTVIAVKAELAERLGDRDPQKAQREMAEIGETARLALREVRAAVAGMHGASLQREIDRAHDALGSAGIDLTVDGETMPLDAAQDAVLAMTLREGVTNIIRHTSATNATLNLMVKEGNVIMSIEDNGQHLIPPERREPISEGNGLRGMRSRLKAAGGALSVSQGGEGLVIRALLRPRRQDATI